MCVCMCVYMRACVYKRGRKSNPSFFQPSVGGRVCVCVRVCALGVRMCVYVRVCACEKEEEKARRTFFQHSVGVNLLAVKSQL